MPAAPRNGRRPLTKVAHALGRAGTVSWVVTVAGLVGFPATGAGQEAAQADRPGVHVETTEQLYRVGEMTLQGVVDRLNATRLEGPGGPPSQGLTEYRIDPEWRARASGGSCSVSRVSIHVRITITLPEWPHAPEVAEGDRQKWDIIERSIREHEYAHRDLTVDAAAELLERLRGLEARGCTTLQRVVSSQVAVADGHLREAHAELDRSTSRRLRLGGRH